MYGEIIINSNARALNRIFDYIVPKEMEKDIKIGSRVFVPFGNTKKLEDGFVIGLKENSEFAKKEIAKLDNKERLTEANISLAKLMARKYFCNISDCIKLMLAPGTASKELANRAKEKKGNFVYLNKKSEIIEEEIQNGILKSEKQIRALRFLYDNEGIYKTDLETIIDVSSAILKTLEKNGYIRILEEAVRRNPFINKDIKRDEAKILNPEQQECFNKIKYSIENESFSANLIYGITGSRKN